ncbi:MAG: arsenate reductase family protein, partial [Lactococcus raffinolactis]
MKTFYWYPKCSTCQRAHKELDMLGVSKSVIPTV